MTTITIEDAGKELTPYSANPLVVFQVRLKRVLPNGDTVESLPSESKRVWSRISNNRTYPRKQSQLFSGVRLENMDNLEAYVPK